MWHHLNTLLGGTGVAVSKGTDRADQRQFDRLRSQVSSGFDAVHLSEPMERQAWVTAYVRSRLERYENLPKAIEHAFYNLVLRLISDSPLFRRPTSQSFDTLSFSERQCQSEILSLQYQLISAQERALAGITRQLDHLIDGTLTYLPLDKLQSAGDDVSINVSLIDLSSNPDHMFDGLCGLLCSQELVATHLCQGLQQQIDQNIMAVSKVTPDDPRLVEKIKAPSEVDLLPVEKLKAYFSHTPFVELFSTALPFPISMMDRFETSHFVGMQGSGKTSEIRAWVMQQLALPRAARATTVIIDSNNKLISELSRLAIFDPTNPNSCSDDILIFDAQNVEHSISINLFGTNLDEHSDLSPQAREGLLTATIETYNYIFSTLLEVDLTGLQKVTFNYLLQLMFVLPEGSNINTLLELLQDIGPYEQYVATLPPACQRFFADRYNQPKCRKTRTEIIQRIDAAQSMPYFSRMFSTKRNALNFREIFDSRKLVLINTGKGQLQEQGTKLVGSLFMSLFTQAVYARFNREEHQPVPVCCFVDEFQDYCATGNIVPQLISQCRKCSVALTLAHQRLSQISSGVRDALMTAAIRYTANVKYEDAQALAREMKTTPEFIKDKVFDKGEKTANFAVTIQGALPRAVHVSRRVDEFNHLPKMSEEAYQRLLDQNYLKVGDFPQASAGASPPPQEPSNGRAFSVSSSDERPHVTLQRKFADLGQSLGFRSETEFPVDGRYIDVALIGHNQKIAIEISDTNRDAYEVTNLIKCLDASYRTFMVSPNPDHLTEIQELARTQLTPEQFVQVHFYSPEQLENWLGSQGFEPNEAGKRGFTLTHEIEPVSAEIAALKAYQLSVLLKQIGAQS